MEKVAVKYIGKRENYTEGTYGSRIEFKQGQSVLVPVELANKLLRHPDVYVPGNEKKAEVVEIVQKDTNEPDEVQNVRDQIASMDKVGLESFAKVNFNIDLDKRKGVENLRQQVIGLVDQFGAA